MRHQFFAALVFILGVCRRSRPLRLAGLALLAALAVSQPVFAQSVPEVIEYYATDHLGSIRVVFDPNGTVLARSDYLPFGEAYAQSGSLPRQRFTGQEHDDETGLEYFNARSLLARTGRFNRPDPLFAGAMGNPQGWNRYAYVGNNPMTFTDPTGEFFVGPILNLWIFVTVRGEAGRAETTITPVTKPVFPAFLEPGSSATASSTVSVDDSRRRPGTRKPKPGGKTNDSGEKDDPGGGNSTTQGGESGQQEAEAIQCAPVTFKVTGVGPRQAPDTTAITFTPRADIADGGVAIKPANFGVATLNRSNRKILAGIRLSADWTTADGPPGAPPIPVGLPSAGPYFPVDVIGPASVRNAPGNQIDVYNYLSQKNAFASTRTVSVVAVIPQNSVGVRCPQ